MDETSLGIGYLVFAIIVGWIASGKNRSFWGYFFLSLFTTPIFAFIVLAIAGEKKTAAPQVYQQVINNGYPQGGQTIYQGTTPYRSVNEFTPLSEAGYRPYFPQMRFIDDGNTASTPYIHFCSNCGSSFSKYGFTQQECPNCGSPLIQTTVLRDTYRSYSDISKDQLKEDFRHGYHLRYLEPQAIPILAAPEPDEAAEEPEEDVPDRTSPPVTDHLEAIEIIRKYKELLDMGAITQEEFEAKKKQVLDL